MMMFELFERLREFYVQCSNRGWCRVINQNGKDFLTVLSSETNFTQLPLNYCDFPIESIISPKLSVTNIAKLDKIISSNDSSRLATINQRGKTLTIRIVNGKGRVILKEKIRLYTVWTPSRGSQINYGKAVPWNRFGRS